MELQKLNKVQKDATVPIKNDFFKYLCIIVKEIYRKK